MATLSNLVYIAAFSFTAVACFLSLGRARRIDDREIRLGLVGLLVGSGAWATSHVAVLLLPGFQPKNAAYLVGLVFGFSTVWTWLYFCSAYTGRTYHRDTRFRRAGLGVYLLVVLVKLTNPLHQSYYTASMSERGFTHLVIQQGIVHWTVTGFSYALASIGLFMLFEQFTESDYDTRIVGALAGLTAIPIVLDIAAYALPQLVNIIHAPFGVAAFALGTLFLFQDRFLAIQVAADVDDGLVFLDGNDRIRDFNGTAARIVPGLAAARGEPVETVDPLADAIDNDQTVLDIRIDGAVRHFLVAESDFSLGQASHGRVLVLTDVSRIERQRRELVRHNEQLEELAVGIRHELRNTLQIVAGNVDAASTSIDRGNPDTAQRALDTAGTTAERMREIVDELSMFAEYSQSVEETSRIDFPAIVEDTWRRSDVEGPRLRVEGTGAIEANQARFEELLAHAFAFAEAVEGSTLTVALDDALVFETDGERPAKTSAETFFEFEESVPTAEAGMALPSFRTLARAHGWDPTFDADYDDGVRIVVEDVATYPAESVASD